MERNLGVSWRFLATFRHALMPDVFNYRILVAGFPALLFWMFSNEPMNKVPYPPRGG